MSWQICITFGGVKHCFKVPLLIAIEPKVLPPPPPNFPELELAATVLHLVNVVQPAVKNSQLTKRLSEVATQFISQVQRELPQGVELIEH
jgi:hypothetical protein